METPFSFRAKFGQYEIEISGTRDEVIKTIKELPMLVGSISKAFEETQGKKTKPNLASSSPYPELSSSMKCSEAVLKLLGSEWGRQPRTLAELSDAMRTNAIHYPSTTLSGVCSWLLKKNKIKRWKTDNGYVYVAAGG